MVLGACPVPADSVGVGVGGAAGDPRGSDAVNYFYPCLIDGEHATQ